MLSEPLGSHSKGENTGLVSAAGEVRHGQFLQTQGRRAVLDTAATEMPRGWGWVTLLCLLWGTVTMTPLTASS